MSTRFWFVRHGEVEAPYVGTFLGRTDVGLSDLGKHQSQAVAAFLEDAAIDAVITSPRARAQATAAPTADKHGLRPEVADGLSEMHFGEWETLDWPTIEARDPEFAARWQADPAHIACPGGEAAGSFAERIYTAFDTIAAEYDGKSVAIFAHAGTNRAFLSRVLGRPYMEMFAFAQDYGNVNAVEWDAHAGHGQVALVNLVPGPRSEAHGDGGRNIE